MIDLNSSHILITGGAGFIGSWLIRELFVQYPQCRITNVDALTYAGNLDNLSDVSNHPNYTFVQGDIRDEGLMTKLVSDVDIVVNAAAQTHVDRSISGPQLFTDTNVMGTQVLLEAVRQAGVKRFVQVSTDEVYGSIEEGGFTESSPIQPNSPYSASKAAADLLVMSYFKTYGMNIGMTRCSNNYGPYQYPEKLIPLFVLNALDDKSLPVYGDGMQIRDWIHVRDHAKAVIRVIESGEAGEIYNIGSNNEWANIQITKTLLELLDKPESLIEYVTDRPGHDRRYAIDSSKMKNTLQWEPSVCFKDGLQETIDWYQENEGWVACVKERAKKANEALEQGVHAVPSVAC